MRRSLRTQLTILFLVIAIVPLLLVTIIGVQQSISTQIDQAIAQQNEVARRVSISVLEYLQDPEVELRVLVETGNIQNLDDAQAQGMLVNLLNFSDVFEEISLLDASGKERIRVSRNVVVEELRNFSGTPAYDEAIKTHNTYYSDISFNEETGEPYLILSIPILDLASGDVSGLLIANLRFKRIWALMSEASSDELTVFMTDTSDRVIAHPNPSVVLQGRNFDKLPAGQLGIGLDDQRAVLGTAPVNFTGAEKFYVIVQEPLQVSLRGSINFAISSGIALLLTIIVIIVFSIRQTRQFTQPIEQLAQAAENIAAGNLGTRVDIASENEVGALSNAFNTMTDRLRELISSLEQRIAERTRNLELAAEVGRSVSQVRELDVMLSDAAELIRKQFDLYYVQVYLVNPSKTSLFLQAGTGDVGAELLKRKHTLPLNTDSINGRAAIERKSVVISDAQDNPTFKANPLLPYTSSEISVPLMLGDKVIGVLDMQSEHGGALNMDSLPAFEALAGQIAIAIQNANFLAEIEKARAEVEEQARRFVRANYIEYMNSIEKKEIGYLVDENKIIPLEAEKQTPANENAMVAPIAITGEEIGSMAVELKGRSPIARTDEFLAAVSRQVAQQVENLRLLDNAERYRAEAEAQTRQTQSALEQVEDQARKTEAALAQAEAESRLTQKLSDAGLEFTRAEDIQAVIKIAIEKLEIPAFNRAVIEVFVYDAEDKITGVDVIANWWSGSNSKPTPIGTHYSIESLPLIELFTTSVPIFIEDAFHDERIDGLSMQLVERLNIHAVAVLPLAIGNRQIGIMLLESEEVYQFKPDEARLFSAMAPQISTVLVNRRQFEQARRQAERETTLNLINQKIQSATTVEAVLQIAARELGHALDLPMTVAQLKMEEND